MRDTIAKPISLILASLLLAACTGQISTPSTTPPASIATNLRPIEVHTEVTETIQDEVIVKYRSGFSTQGTRPAPLLNGAKVLDTFNTSEETTQLQHLPKDVKLDDALKTYAADPAVEFAVPNVNFKVQMSAAKPVAMSIKASSSASAAVVPTRKSTATAVTSSSVEVQDPLGNQQWYLSALGMNQVWSDYGTGSAGVTVAVLDTGVDYTHPDLAGKIIKGPDYVDSDFDPKDEHGHGTHVTGIIVAGLNNQQGIAGLAPQVHVMAIRVLDAKGSGSLFRIAKGIAYAANNGARVINLSLGSPPGGFIMKSLANFLASYAERKGALIVAAAGNAGGAIGYPAAASKFLSVGAVNQQNYLASFSNRGPELGVVAPGVDILSTFPTYDVTTNAEGLPHNYASLNGTSMATPMVSALAAMIISKDPYLTPEQVRQRILTTATDLGTIGRDDMFGNGLINPARALAKQD